MSPRRRFLLHSAWILTTVLVIGGGVVACQRLQDWAECPNGSGSLDSRAYPAQRQQQCDGTNEATDTYDHMLRYYSIALPATATGVRYLNLTPWNGPDQLFLRFSADQLGVGQLIGSLHATPDPRGVAYEVSPESTLLDEYHLDDWTFPEPASDYAVYTFGGQSSSTNPVGWVIVEQSAPLRTVFLLSAV